MQRTRHFYEWRIKRAILVCMTNLTDSELEALIAELAADGIEIPKEDARDAVRRFAALLLIISQPLPRLSSDDSALHAEQDRFP